MKTESSEDRPASAKGQSSASAARTSDLRRGRHETVEVVKRNWRAEVETAQVYRELASRETDEKRKGILNRMAEAEERHARRWEQKLIDLGQPAPTLPDTIGRRFKRWLNRGLGTEI